ncbi:MAG: TM2 domain-containing protein [Bacteroidetes bacterium]|nr:TM2 domain-containing protein [Bacteroidota bacterium]MBK8673802.1 TM2 domain-containing protein [Bacteroidota bacterium]MBL0287887.1 TM2 domain-containing protein [Bacteroidota bacterium]
MKQQSRGGMLLLAIIFGQFGLHRRAMGYSNWIWMPLTAGGFAIWWFYDIYRIYKNKLPMADGKSLLD